MRNRQAELRPRRGAIGAFAGGLGLAVAALACGCTREPKAPSPPAVAPFTIMTFNVNFGMPAPAEAAAAIRQAGADVVCLQETNVRWQRYLDPRLRETYPHRRYLPSGGGGGGMAVLSRYALGEPAALPPPEGGWFPAWLVEVHTPGSAVQVLCVHLRPSLSDEGRVGIGPYMKAPRIRKREAQQHAARLDAGRPAIILGDFNEGDRGAAVSWLRDRGFADALGRFDPWSPTWVWRTRLITLRDRLDHILHSRHLRCTAARVVKQGGSDHYPVVATFHLKPEPAAGA